MVFGPSCGDFSALSTFLAEACRGGFKSMSTPSETTPPRTLEITRLEEFSASHRLHDPRLSDEENVALYGLCNNLHGHGHNYQVEVSVRGVVPQSGMVMDLNVLHAILHEELIARVDHRHLNHDVEFLAGVVTTAENLAVAFFELLEGRINDQPGCALSRVRVYESAANSAEYCGAVS
jgi:6-pyruvoyltetrahydropterin/6-carboxytetrahydropterin synthase